MSEFRGKEEEEEEEETYFGGEDGDSAAAVQQQLLAEVSQSSLAPASLSAASVGDVSPDLKSHLGASRSGGGAGAATAGADQSSRVSELAEENSALKLRVRGLEADAARHGARSADLQRQLQDHTTALKKAHERETELQGRLTQLQSEHTLLAEQARASETERDTARAADAAAHSKETQELRAQSDYATTQVQRLQGERSELKKEVTRLESRLAEEIAKAAAAIARSHQNDAAAATLDVKVAEAAELREALSQCEALVENHRSKAAAAAAERDALGAEVAELRSTTTATDDLHTAELHNARTQAQVAENAAEEAAQALSQALAEKTSAAREVELLRAHLLKGTELIARQQKALDRLGAVGPTAGARSASRAGGTGSRKGGPRKNASSPSGATRAKRRSKEKQESPTSRTRSKTPTSSGAQKSAGSRTHNRESEVVGSGNASNMFAREEERRRKKLQREDEKRKALKAASMEGCTFKPDLSVSARKKKPVNDRSASVGRGNRTGSGLGSAERAGSDRNGAGGDSPSVTRDTGADAERHDTASSRGTGSPESRAPLGAKLIAGETEWRTYEPTDRS